MHHRRRRTLNKLTDLLSTASFTAPEIFIVKPKRNVRPNITLSVPPIPLLLNIVLNAFGYESPSGKKKKKSTYATIRVIITYQSCKVYRINYVKIYSNISINNYINNRREIEIFENVFEYFIDFPPADQTNVMIMIQMYRNDRRGSGWLLAGR